MKWFLIFFLSFNIFCQPDKIGVLGNFTPLCFSDSSYIKLHTIPENLNDYDAIMIFSTANNSLNDEAIFAIINYVENGGSLYLGAENWPLQAEANQVTQAVYKKEVYGDYDLEIAVVEKNTSTNLKSIEYDSIPAGKTTVAFPLDYRLQVEAWVEDQPLISSGKIGIGRIIIDGGYSRFYCSEQTETGDKLFISIISYLLRKD